MKKLLFISNGHGEDSIAATIIKALKQSKTENLTIKALPLVGEGTPYKKLEIETLGPTKVLPSYGFAGQSFLYLIKDIFSGLLSLTWQQKNALRKEAQNANLIISVGDIYPLLFASLFGRKPLFHIDTAISTYIKKYNRIETWIMRRYCQKVFSRDEKTAENLRQAEVAAVYAGNVMMDEVKINNIDFGFSKDTPLISLIPSSREDAYENTKIILSIIANIRKKDINYLLPLAPSLSLEKLISTVRQSGWSFHREEKVSSSISGEFSSPMGRRVRLTEGNFFDAINQSTLILGMTGTGNEQAAGLGKTIITLAGKGPHTSKKRLHLFQKLLGDAAVIAPKEPKQAAQIIEDLIDNPLELKRRGEVGRQRMGPPGGAERIAAATLEQLQAK